MQFLEPQALPGSMLPMLERLQKILARAGVASRRHAEQLILAGHVSVNGKVVTELGTKADPDHDSIKVGGKLIRLPESNTYVVLHKPAGCVCTMSDPQGRQSLRELLRGVRGRVFPVGRLDYHAEGLLLLTDDGELANRVLKAGGNLQQIYWIKVRGQLSEEERGRVQHAAGGRLRLLKDAPNAWYEAVLSDARRDRLRRSLVRLGHPVEKMKRVRLANLHLATLSPGEYRYLTPQEIEGLSRAVARARKPERNLRRAV